MFKKKRIKKINGKFNKNELIVKKKTKQDKKTERSIRIIKLNKKIE